MNDRRFWKFHMNFTVTLLRLSVWLLQYVCLKGRFTLKSKIFGVSAVSAVKMSASSMGPDELHL